MAENSISQDFLAPQTCSYVLRIDSVDESASKDDIRRMIQSFLGNDHEVISVDRMKFHSVAKNDSSSIQNVVKVKTCAPSLVATKLIGNTWVRSEHVIYKSLPPAGS